MISNDEIKARFIALPEVKEIRVSGDGYHYQLTVVADIFEGMTKLKRQQWVYAQLKVEITQGQLHALTMETWTPGEWENKNG